MIITYGQLLYFVFQSAEFRRSVGREWDCNILKVSRIIQIVFLSSYSHFI